MEKQASISYVNPATGETESATGPTESVQYVLDQMLRNDVEVLSYQDL